MIGPVRQGSLSASLAGARSCKWLSAEACETWRNGIYMDEGRGDNHAGAKILCYEERPFWYSNSFVTSSIDRKRGAFVGYQLKEIDESLGYGLPNNEPIRMMKMADTRRPIWPSKSLSAVHLELEGSADATAVVAAAWYVCRARTLAIL